MKTAIRRLPVMALSALFWINWRDFRFVELMWGCQMGAAYVMMGLIKDL